MMTFQEMRTKNPSLYPSQIQQIDKETINDWFDFRYVCDDEKFPVFFKRYLNLYYNRYLELQRLEPGYAKYDWLVNNYLELQKTTIGDIENNSNSSITGSNSNTTTNNLTNTITNSGSDSSSQTNNNTINNTTTNDLTNTLTNSGKDTGSQTSESSTTNTTTNNLTDNTRSNTSVKNNQSVTVSGSNSGSDTSRVTGGKTSDVRTVDKSLPLSSSNIGKQTTNIGGDADPIISITQIGSLDFAEATRQNEVSSNSGTVENTNNTNQSTSTTTTSYTGDADQTVNEGTTARTGTVKVDSTISTSNSNEINYGKIETSENSGTVTISGTNNTTADNTINYGKVETAANTGTIANEGSNSSTSTGNSTIKNNSKEQIQQTGHSGNIAAILDEACEFIRTSSAFYWLKDKLEELFICVYDI